MCKYTVYLSVSTRGIHVSRFECLTCPTSVLFTTCRAEFDPGSSPGSGWFHFLSDLQIHRHSERPPRVCRLSGFSLLYVEKDEDKKIKSWLCVTFVNIYFNILYYIQYYRLKN